MAEPIGLAMSGIALAGLFKTCVEIIEYFEQGKNWAKDIRLALTKMSLMKRRLSQWGAAMSIETPGAEAQALRNRWPVESRVIMETLMGIRDILGTTTYMCRRYHCSNEQDPAHWLKWRIDDDSCSDRKTVTYSSPTSRSSTLRTVRLKAAWAVQDRKKFQALIADFDFLLSNLEKIGEKLQKEGIMAGRAECPEDSDSDLIDTKTISPTTTQATTPEPDGPVFFKRKDSLQLNTTSRMPPTNPNPNSQNGFTIVDPSNTSTPEQYNFGTRTEGQHVVWKNTSSGNALLLPGDYFRAGHVPNSSKGHNFVCNHAEGDSVHMMGNSDAESREQMMRDRDAARAEREKQERADRQAGRE